MLHCGGSMVLDQMGGELLSVASLQGYFIGKVTLTFKPLSHTESHSTHAGFGPMNRQRTNKEPGSLGSCAARALRNSGEVLGLHADLL